MLLCSESWTCCSSQREEGRGCVNYFTLWIRVDSPHCSVCQNERQPTHLSIIKPWGLISLRVDFYQHVMLYRCIEMYYRKSILRRDFLQQHHAVIVILIGQKTLSKMFYWEDDHYVTKVFKTVSSLRILVFGVRIVWAAWEREIESESVCHTPDAWELATLRKWCHNCFPPLRDS